MSLVIKAVKPIRFISADKDYIGNKENLLWIDCLGYPEIQHTKLFNTGWYEVREHYSNSRFEQMSRRYNQFRDIIARVVYERGFEEIHELVDAGKLPKYTDFYELFMTSDSEGCIDYVVAKKMLNEINKHIFELIDVFKDARSEFENVLKQFIAVLLDVVECHGVAYYY